MGDASWLNKSSYVACVLGKIAGELCKNRCRVGRHVVVQGMTCPNGMLRWASGSLCALVGHGDDVVAILVVGVFVDTLFARMLVKDAHLGLQRGFSGPRLAALAKGDVVTDIEAAEAEVVVVVVKAHGCVAVDKHARAVTKGPRETAILTVAAQVFRCFEEGNVHGPRRIAELKVLE